MEVKQDRLLRLLIWGLIASLGLLVVMSFRLMVIRGEYYRNLAAGNKVRSIEIPASRGKIIDRKGRVIALDKFRYGNEVAGDFFGWKFEGKELLVKIDRYYPYGECLAPVTGWLGKSGVELTQNEILAGEAGKRLIEVDALGKYVRELGRENPKNGQDLGLTIDAYWQEKLYKIMAGVKGAGIVSEPKTGRIIAMVSTPSYDPNVFTNILDRKKIEEYLNDTDGSPLLNRAVGAKYHPGSVFKIAVATGGLEEEIIKKTETIEDSGVIRVGNYSYANWLWNKSGGTDGQVDMVKALRRSNDIYFYRLGEKMGPDRIKNWANKFGLGERTGVEVQGEVTGLIPNEDWKWEAKRERWFLGNTYHMAIGQGEVEVSPIQVNLMTNVVASNGKKCQMTLVSGKEKCVDLKIRPETLAVIRDGMIAACDSGGTAYPLVNFKTKLACKTGTAEVGDGTKDTHAWLTAFAPALDPEISITLMVEKGGEGSDVAAPLVGDFLKEWFSEAESGTIIVRKNNQ
jgi:penicillin-binding protein 2